MAFVKYTDQQIKEASEVDIVDLLRRRGEKVEAAGSEHEWKHGGDTIKIRGGNGLISMRTKVGTPSRSFGNSLKKVSPKRCNSCSGEAKANLNKPSLHRNGYGNRLPFLSLTKVQDGYINIS